MELNFNKVSYDGELEDFSEDELRELVGEFEDAQESNVAEFKTAVEATEGLDEGDLTEFEQAREDLLDSIVEHENFEEVPLSEDKLGEETFAELQDWSDFVADLGDDGETQTDDSDSEDFGKRSPVQSDDDEAEFVDEALGGMQGLNLN